MGQAANQVHAPDSGQTPEDSAAQPRSPMQEVPRPLARSLKSSGLPGLFGPPGLLAREPPPSRGMRLLLPLAAHAAVEFGQ
eukprot:5642126-Lingulodinium_polyedra.AAC.1